MALLTFTLPPDAGEKISLGTSAGFKPCSHLQPCVCRKRQVANDSFDRSTVASTSLPFSCLSVHSRISQEPHVRISANFTCTLPVAVARSSSGGVVIRCVLPVLWITSRFCNGPYGDVTLRRQHRCSVCTAHHFCCIVLVVSCPSPRQAPRLDESFVQGVPG